MAKIHEILGEHIRSDYYTANIKAEVIFDTIFTPVIGNMLTVIGQKNEKTGIKGEMKLLAKEFPMLKMRDEKGEKKDFRSCNADYLMCDENTVYFVELKTTQGSCNFEQMKKYSKYLNDYRDRGTFADTAGKDFILLLEHVSKTGSFFDESKDGIAKEPWEKADKKMLKWLFEIILNYQTDKGKTVFPQDGWEKNGINHADRAISYLRNEKADSSKKYLLTAGQMLDRLEDGGWWDCKQRKLLCLMPENLTENQLKVLQKQAEFQPEDMIIVTFREIVEQTYFIGKEMEKNGLKNYWKWVSELFVSCGLY